MKLTIKRIAKVLFGMPALLICFSVLVSSDVQSQDSTNAEEPAAPVKAKPVKHGFQSIWIIDNQTTLVPVKGTFEMDFMHRFGTWDNGYQDFWGLFAPSNIRLGASYAPIAKLSVGIGVTKTTAGVIPKAGISAVEGPLWDGSLKYAIFSQTKGKYPVSLTYYVNAAYNTKADPDHEIYRYSSDRWTFFHQLLISRKINNKLIVQVAPSLSHHNVANGYFTKLNDSTLKVNPSMEFNHFAIAFSARYKLTTVTSLLFNYDQPLTKHATNNPNPSMSFGFEFNTSSHSFQIFFTNFYYLNPATNNLYNSNNPFAYTDHSTDDPNTATDESTRVSGGKFLIGFNITRLWNY